MSNIREQKKKRRGLDIACGERGPTGWVDATNYLVDSVNWSHSDWANPSNVSLPPFTAASHVFVVVGG